MIGKLSSSRSNSSNSGFGIDISGKFTERFSSKFKLSRSASSSSFNNEAKPATPDFAEGRIKQFLLDLSKSYNKQTLCLG